MYENLDVDNLVSPIDYLQLDQLLTETNYDKKKKAFLVESFKEGFDLGYRGPEQVKLTAHNLKFTIGDEIELWNKVMSEVKEKRYAGPFPYIPFESYIQSPIGLVPKDGGKKTRLIFHLSYPRLPQEDEFHQKSVNANTPKNLTSVSYKDFDAAVQICLLAGRGCGAAKSDLSSAFRHLCIAKKWWKYLVMKAKNPVDKKFYYFFDKCLPFGASISCAHFQAVSDALAHIVRVKSGFDNLNYLDDFFFVALLKALCNNQIKIFLEVCELIKFPVAIEKTVWATTWIVFLGLVIDTLNQRICIPIDKVTRAVGLISTVLERPGKKTTLRELQNLTGFLNFLGKAIVPGRTFTRRLYTYTSGVLKAHHHIRVNGEMRLDLQMWLKFLNSPQAYCRSFFDYTKFVNSLDIDMFSDASANPLLGCGGINNQDWFILQWDEKFIRQNSPSINYLELYAVAFAVLAWIWKYSNQNVTLFCDNLSVVHMVNNASSNCKHCMIIIRILTMHCLRFNINLTAKHVSGVQNKFSDSLSRLEYKKFRGLAREVGRHFNNQPTPVPTELWPMDKVWFTEPQQKKRARKASFKEKHQQQS